MRRPLYGVFKAASRLLRHSLLRRLPWVVRVHSEVFRLLQPGGPLSVGPFMVHVDPRDRLIAKKLALYGQYEAFESELIRSLLSPGDTFVDVGANIGLHTLWASRAVGPGGRVVAFEPDPSNFALLAQNVAWNRCANVELVAKAVCDKPGQLLLYQNEENRGKLSLRDLTHSGRAVAVEATTLDAHLQGQDRPIGLIKMDIEGAEPLALAGMSKTLDCHSEVALLVEFTPIFIRAFGQSPEGFLAELRVLGYRLWCLDEGRRVLEETSPEELLALATQAGAPMNILCRRG